MLVVMSAATQIAIEEYVRSLYHPDREFVDGEVRERSVGEFEHGELQGELFRYLRGVDRRYRLFPVVECRVQVSPTRFRVPDVSIVRGARPKWGIITDPPFAVIEVLSPEDSWADMAERIDDYTKFGVPNIWIIDPVRRRAFWMDRGVRVEVADLVLTTTDQTLQIPLAEIFRSIDELE